MVDEGLTLLNMRQKSSAVSNSPHILKFSFQSVPSGAKSRIVVKQGPLAMERYGFVFCHDCASKNDYF